MLEAVRLPEDLMTWSPPTVANPVVEERRGARAGVKYTFQ